MFDPSKLNLDLDNLDNKDTKKNNTDNQNIEEKTGTNKQNTQKKDILNFNGTYKKEQKIETKINNKNTKLTEKQDNSENKENQENKKENNITNKSNNLTKAKKQKENNIIFDINLNSAEILLDYLIENKYEFFTITPNEDKVTIDFFSNKILKEKKYIKYPTYTKILLKLKSIAKLKVEITEKSQEWNWEIIIKWKTYKILAKTVSSNLWEKIFIKALETSKKAVKKKTKKTSITTIFSFLWAIIFIALVLWWAFISFVVMNAKTIEDVKFFYRLWINLNDINNFIETTIWIIFSIIALLEILALIIFLFKFLFTKKEFKKKRITRWIISFLILLITFITISGWMFIDKKIRELPNWQELAYWNIQILNNDLLNKPKIFSREAALINNTTNLIWPINIKFDLTNFANSEKEKWIKINKYIWNFWKNKNITTLEPNIIRKFNEKWTYKVNLTIEEIDLHWKLVDKKVENIPSIEIWHIVKITEQKLDNWWKIVKFDASDLKDLWKINWYFINKEQKNNFKPVYTWYNFNPAKVIFEDTIIWLEIQKANNKNNKFDKIFVINAINQNDIKWTIEAIQNPINDLNYTFKVKNINSDFWNGFIEQFKWNIDNIKTRTLKSNIDNLEQSSEIKIQFKKYWKHIIKVELKDGNWNIKTIEKTINIKKSITLSHHLDFINNWITLDNIKYQAETHEYFLKNIKAPTTLTISAKNLESDNILEYLKKVEWDINWNWDIDQQWKILNFNIEKWWNYKINVIYTFQNKRIKTQLTQLKETIYIDAETKEVMLNLKIKKSRDYAPVNVSFDASDSHIKWKNITKFIFDYWDWTPPDVRDAINPWHRYLNPWNYTIKLTIVTSDGKEYSIEKKLILKPLPQKAQITVSMEKVPVFTPIDFSSNKSIWEIVNYFWDFWDWNTSTDANPSHMYKKPWTYKVKLILDFKNKNTLSAEKDIIVNEQ